MQRQTGFGDLSSWNNSVIYNIASGQRDNSRQNCSPEHWCHFHELPARLERPVLESEWWTVEQRERERTQGFSSALDGQTDRQKIDVLSIFFSSMHLYVLCQCKCKQCRDLLLMHLNSTNTTLLCTIPFVFSNRMRLKIQFISILNEATLVSNEYGSRVWRYVQETFAKFSLPKLSNLFCLELLFGVVRLDCMIKIQNILPILTLHYYVPNREADFAEISNNHQQNLGSAIKQKIL